MVTDGRLADVCGSLVVMCGRLVFSNEHLVGTASHFLVLPRDKGRRRERSEWATVNVHLKGAEHYVPASEDRVAGIIGK